MNSLSQGKFISLIKKNKWTIFENDLNIIRCGSTISELCTSFKFNSCLNIIIHETVNTNIVTPKVLQNPNNKVFTENDNAGPSFIIAYYEGPNCKPLEKQQFHDSFLNLIKMLSVIFNFCQQYKQDQLFEQHLKKYSFKSSFFNKNQNQNQHCENNISDIINRIGDKESIVFNSPNSYDSISFSLLSNIVDVKPLLKHGSIFVYKKNYKDLIYVLLEEPISKSSSAIQKIKSNLLFQYIYIFLTESNKFNIEVIKLTSQLQVNSLEEIISSNSYHDGYHSIQSPGGFSLSNSSMGGCRRIFRGSSCFSVPLISPSLSLKSSTENSPNLKKRVSPHSYSPIVSKNSINNNNNNNNYNNNNNNNNNNNKKGNSINENNENNNNNEEYTLTSPSAISNINLETLSSNRLSPAISLKSSRSSNYMFTLPLSPTSNTIEHVKDNQGNEITKINQVSYIEPHIMFKAFQEFNERKINWLLVGYEGKNMKLVGKGVNGLPELKQQLNESKAYFGVVGITFSDSRNFGNNTNTLTYKGLFIEWLGNNSCTRERAMIGSHSPAVTLLFKQKSAIHCDLRCDDIDDLSEDYVLQKVTSFRQEIQFKKVVNSLTTSSNNLIETVI
ncbi:hypothetical protein ACTFIT_006611 [Dictyostelium discoideum]